MALAALLVPKEEGEEDHDEEGSSIKGMDGDDQYLLEIMYGDITDQIRDCLDAWEAKRW